MRTLVFLGAANDFSGDGGSMQLELWYEPERERQTPTAAATKSKLRGHVGIAVSAMDAFVDRLDASGVQVLQRPAALRAGGRRLAMIADPDGHEIELLEAP